MDINQLVAEQFCPAESLMDLQCNVNGLLLAVIQDQSTYLEPSIPDKMGHLLLSVPSAWSRSGLPDRWFGYDMVNCKDFCSSKVIVCTNHRLCMRKILARC